MSDKPIEAEVVEQSQALAIRPQTGLPTVQDLEQQFALAVRQRELLSEYIKKQLKAGKHFYQRGSQKPSLAKEGAEIILLPHNLAPDYEQTGGPDSPPLDDRPYQITVKCVLRRKGDPQSFVGSGIGSAGSHKGTWGGPNKKNWLYEPRQTDKYLCHNATLKMAQKSAMIAATINSTAASEFFTQDMDPDGEPTPKGTPKPSQPSRPPSTTTPPIKTPPAPAKAQQQRFPTDKTRAWMIKELKAGQGQECRAIVTEYFHKVPQLLETEQIEDLPLRYVPISKEQLAMLAKKIGDFEAGADAEAAFPPNAEEPPAETKAAIPAKKPKDDEWWREIIVSVPRKGMKKAEYEKNPETIGQLFDMRHGNDDESAAARQRLFGLVHSFDPKPREYNGKVYQPSAADLKCREALDALAEWWEKNHPGEEM